MNDDIISRQAAIDKLITEANHEGAYGYIDAKEAEDTLNALPSISPITPDEFRDRMYEIIEKYGGYEESVHIEMDELMCELLKSLGYESGVKIFEKQEKWYS